MSKKKEDKIYSVLSSIDATLKLQSSGKRIFMQGLIRGLGTALGATVLLAIVTSLTIQFVDALDWASFSQYFFSEVVTE
jgi:hypothetical protein